MFNKPMASLLNQGTLTETERLGTVDLLVLTSLNIKAIFFTKRSSLVKRTVSDERILIRWYVEINPVLLLLLSYLTTLSTHPSS
jgi:hypothetical protein